MGGGLFDNLSPYDMYEPTRTGVRNGGAYSWPRSPVMDPNVFREPEYNNATRYVRPQWNDRSTAVGASPIRNARDSSGERSERSSSPVVRKVRTIPVQDGSNEVPQWTSNTAPVNVVKESGKDRFPSANGDSASTSRKSSRAMDATTAATVIQSVYQGYTVRRTQPLKHLRIISKVRLELKELVSRAAEPEQFDKLRRDGLERLKWNEVIMAMLLRLDSIQGAHPVVRDIRKSVAKEVVQFQEIVDAALDSHDEARGVEKENGDDMKASSDTILDEETAELNDTEGSGSVGRDGESAAYVQDLEGEDLEHLDIEGCTAAYRKFYADEDVNPQQASVGEDEPVEAESHTEMETPASVSIYSQSACIADTEMTDAREGIALEDFVPQPPRAAASNGLPETADLDLYENRTGKLECGEDTVVASGTLVTSVHDDDSLVADEEAGHAGVSFGQEHSVMEVCPFDGGFPSLQAIAKDSGRDTGEYEKVKDDTQFTDVEELQPKSHNDATELKVRVQEEGSVSMQQEVAMGTSQLEEAGSSGSSSKVVVCTERETSGGNPSVMEETSSHNKISKSEKSSGIAEEEMDVGKDDEPMASLVTVDLEEDVPIGAMMCNECGSPGGSTEVMLGNVDAPNNEIELLNWEGMAGAAGGETDHGKHECTSSLPCLRLETPRVSGHGERIEAISGDLARGATEVGDTHTSSAIISPELTTLGEVRDLSDRALMQKLLEENRKLKAAIGEVLQWGKQQSDIIHNLATRIGQLEAKVSGSNLLKNGMKKRSKTIELVPRDTLSAGEEVESVCRLPRSGRFGRHHGRNRLLNLEYGHWSSSAESEDFF